MIKNRQSAYTDPHRSLYGPEYDPATMGVFRSTKSSEEFKRRPEALRSGAGNMMNNGMSTPYEAGVGKPLIQIQGPVEQR